MKKGLKILGVCLIIILNAVCFCSCSLTKDKTFVYDDYFVCCIYRSQICDEIAIVELTELGKEQEILIIPETINGLKVVSLGGDVPELVYPDKKVFFSNNLKKIYVPFIMELLGSRLSLNNATLISLINKEEYNNNDIYLAIGCKRQVLLFERERKLENVFCANCFFYKNEEMVWADYIADGEVYALPAYLQIDWYLEPDCINLWNGEYVIPDGQEQLNLYSK